jgi:2'-5' RNA ligase
VPELVVIAPLSPIQVGDRFDQGKVPLHLTTLPKFRVHDESLPTVLSAIGNVAAAMRPITVTPTNYAQFGHAGRVTVTTVAVSADLRRLHERLSDGVQRAGARPNEPAYNGDGYRPHITHTHDGHAIHPGEMTTLASLAVLDCSQPARQITTLWPLSG